MPVAAVREAAYLRSVLHDGAVVVGQAELCRVAQIELTDQAPEIIPAHLDVFVAVGPLLLVPQTKAVANLVQRRPELRATRNTIESRLHEADQAAPI